MSQPSQQHSPRWLSLLHRAIFRSSRAIKVSRLYLEITHRCNLACPSCYTDAGTEKPDALTLAEQQSVVDQAREMGARIVSLSGSGEPLLYPALLELIDYIRARDMSVVMFTNGTACTPDMARNLLDRNVVVYFQLSSLIPEVLDRMTGRDNTHEWVPYTYDYDGASTTTAIPRGLKNLLDRRSASTATDLVRLEALITRVNHTSLHQVAAFSRALALPLHLEVPVFTGRALVNRGQLALRRDDYRRLHEQLTEILGGEFLEAHRVHQCPVERNPVVRTNGDVGICSSRDAQVGNVRDAPLRELFIAATERKQQQDRTVGRRCNDGTYFHTCRARRFYEFKYGLPHEY